MDALTCSLAALLLATAVGPGHQLPVVVQDDALLLNRAPAQVQQYTDQIAAEGASDVRADRELVRPGAQPDGDEEARRAVRRLGLEDVSRRRLPPPGHRGQGGRGLGPRRGAGPGVLGAALGRAEGLGPQRPRALHAQAGRVRAVRARAGAPLLGHVPRPRPAREDAARGAPVGAVERAQPARVPHAPVAAGQERAAAGVAARLPLALPGRLRGDQGRDPGQPGAAGQHGAERAQLRR